MVRSVLLENNHRNMWKWPEQIITDVSGGQKRPINSEDNEREPPVNKRRKSSSSQTVYELDVDDDEFPISLSQYDPFNEPNPLGLRLTKSPSFLELAQAMVSQGNHNNTILPTQNIQVINKKYAKPKVGTSGPIDKLKASNFPALLLRIGKWEYVSQHEGDLMAKCYFSKHKIVWEVLNGGLKNKIEIQWSDIVGLKADCPDNGPGILTIVLDKQPLFFKETNPQPRKHTIWQTSSDFTHGEASRYRQHYLQCAPGVLNKHYEKLIQCDTRLNSLNQQPVTVFDLPFTTKASIKDPNISGQVNGQVNGPVKKRKFHHNMSISAIVNHIGHCISEKNPTQILPFSKGSSLKGSNTLGQVNGQVNKPKLQQTTRISNLVNHIGHRISEKNLAQIFSGIDQNDMLDNISEILLNDTKLTTSLDEKNLMSRVNSLCCLIDDGNDYSTPDSEMNNIDDWYDSNDYCMPDCDMFLENGDFGMLREYSFSDLLHNLPEVASIPKLFVDSYKE